MVKGVPLSDREKRFILSNTDSQFPSQIAKELGIKLPLDNGGHRSAKTVKQFLKQTSE